MIGIRRDTGVCPSGRPVQTSGFGGGVRYDGSMNGFAKHAIIMLLAAGPTVGLLGCAAAPSEERSAVATRGTGETDAAMDRMVATDTARAHALLDEEERRRQDEQRRPMHRERERVLRQPVAIYRQ